MAKVAQSGHSLTETRACPRVALKYQREPLVSCTRRPRQITHQITVNEQLRHPLGFHRSIVDMLEKSERAQSQLKKIRPQLYLTAVVNERHRRCERIEPHPQAA